jgi:hypothetical protein
VSARALMVQGCTSDAGKTTLVAALCRILAASRRQGRAVQAAEHGAQLGRHRRRRRDRARPGLQALAAGLAPRIDFNPVLLKPTTDRRAQVIIHGRAVDTLNARDYHEYKTRRDGRGDGKLGAPHGRIRLGDRRRRRQPGRDQPARPRHRQHGLRRGGRRAGDPDRRHRPRRRLRPSGRHPGPALGVRTGARQGASSSTAFAATSACSNRASTGWSSAPASRCSACCPTCTA